MIIDSPTHMMNNEGARRTLRGYCVLFIKQSFDRRGQNLVFSDGGFWGCVGVLQKKNSLDNFRANAYLYPNIYYQTE
ncbi:MAG: hypothetical protein HY088_01325 [Ignavibacteriales bacterium]|nr:hypothetical protein [Ignavibacteriales bacterium]